MNIEHAGCLLWSRAQAFNFQFSIINLGPENCKLKIENRAAWQASQLAGMAGVLAGELAGVLPAWVRLGTG